MKESIISLSEKVGVIIATSSLMCGSMVGRGVFRGYKEGPGENFKKKYIYFIQFLVEFVYPKS